MLHCHTGRPNLDSTDFVAHWHDPILAEMTEDPSRQQYGIYYEREPQADNDDSGGGWVLLPP